MTERLFFAISLPEDVRRLLEAVQDPAFKARWTKPEQMHVTLKFLGAVANPQKETVIQQVQRARAQSFTMRIRGVGNFGSRVLWAGIDAPAALGDLQRKLEAACVRAGFEPDDRAFHAHVTLARLKGNRPDWLKPFLARHRELASRPFDIASVELFRSTLQPSGARYDVVESIRLDG